MNHHKAGLDEPSLEDDLFDIPDRIAIKGGFWGINGGAKPTVDVLISLLALVFLAPLMLLVFLAIKCNCGGAFYVQSRVGRGGKLFRMYKFRTMHTNAGAVLKQRLETDQGARAEWSRFQKLRNDPRVTRIGGSCARRRSTSCRSCSMC
jgi:exopolysaccharide production protein ExoY